MAVGVAVKLDHGLDPARVSAVAGLHIELRWMGAHLEDHAAAVAEEQRLEDHQLVPLAGGVKAWVPSLP